MRILLAILFLALLSPAASAGDSDLARTPPMGWNSWNQFNCRISDKLIRRTADEMASNGMRDAGYVYLTIDDCWQGQRDASGVLHPSDKFPDMKALGDYIHGKGLKFGIYSSPGPTTCMGRPGSLDHEEQDAKMFASWGVDYLKYDWCGARKLYKIEDMPRLYAKMHDALRRTDRPIVYSLCQYGWGGVWTWGASVGGNLWRTTEDISASFESIAHRGFAQSGLEQYAGPGHWNDPDMLEVGNGDLTLEENRFHISLWSMLAAPLIAGNDLVSMDDETLGVLTNREVLAIDQDALGKQARRIKQAGPMSIWLKPLADGSYAVGFFSTSERELAGSITLKELGLPRKASVRDLWAKRDLGVVNDKLEATPSRHGVVLLKVTPLH